MIRIAQTLVLVALLASAAFAEKYPVQQTETIRRTLDFAGSSRVLELDNVNGSIHVTGYDGRSVEMVANKTVRAESQDHAQRAEQEVKLDITDKADIVRIYVDGPFRHRWRQLGYEVDFNFDLRVPRDVRLRLRTVNGETDIQRTVGDFEVHDVNGKITMSDITGSGSAQTVNGEVKVSFLENPKFASSFKTVNGSIEAAFQPNLSADLQLKTFNGGLFTDFPTTTLPSTAAVERRNGKFIYRRNRFTAVRIGNGGPEITFDGLNSDVRVLSRTK